MLWPLICAGTERISTLEDAKIGGWAGTYCISISPGRWSLLVPSICQTLLNLGDPCESTGRVAPKQYIHGMAKHLLNISSDFQSIGSFKTIRILTTVINSMSRMAVRWHTPRCRMNNSPLLIFKYYNSIHQRSSCKAALLCDDGLTVVSW